MRSVLFTFVSLLSAWSSLNAQDAQLHGDDQINGRHPPYGTDVRMYYLGPFVLQTGKYTLLFPFKTIGFGTDDPHVTIPFLLAVVHDGNAVVRYSDDWGTPTPVTIMTAQKAVTARLCLVRPDADDHRAKTDTSDSREEMHFYEESPAPVEPLRYEMQHGRVFVITLPGDSASVRISQHPEFGAEVGIV